MLSRLLIRKENVFVATLCLSFVWILGIFGGIEHGEPLTNVVLVLPALVACFVTWYIAKYWDILKKRNRQAKNARRLHQKNKKGEEKFTCVYNIIKKYVCQVEKGKNTSVRCSCCNDKIERKNP